MTHKHVEGLKTTRKAVWKSLKNIYFIFVEIHKTENYHNTEVDLHSYKAVGCNISLKSFLTLLQGFFPGNVGAASDEQRQTISSANLCIEKENGTKANWSLICRPTIFILIKVNQKHAPKLLSSTFWISQNEECRFLS